MLRSTITNFSPTRAREGARKTGQTRPGGGRGGYARLSNPHTIPYAPCLSVSRQVGRSVGGHSSDVEIHCLQRVISGSPRASTRPRTRAPCKLPFACTRARTRAVSPNGCAETRSRLESWSVASDVSLRPERAHASPVSDPRAPRSSSHRTSGTWRAPRASNSSALAPNEHERGLRVSPRHLCDTESLTSWACVFSKFYVRSQPAYRGLQALPSLYVVVDCRGD